MSTVSTLKNLDIAQLNAHLHTLPEPLRFEDFRRSLWQKTTQLPTSIQYGLGIVADYAQVAALVAGMTSAKHNVRVMEGATLCAFSDIPSESDRARTYLAESSHTFSDALTASTWSEGVAVLCAKDGELHLDSTLSGIHGELFVVVVRNGAKLTVTEKLCGETNVVSSRTVVAFVEEGSTLEYHTQATAALSGTTLLRRHAFAATGARVHFHEVTRFGDRLKIDTSIDLEGEKATGQILYAGVNAGSRFTDVLHTIRHLAPYTHSRIAAGGVAMDASRTIYRGNVDIKKNTRGADGAQEARFVVIDPTAKVDAIPALDIAEGQVHAGHKLSVGYLSPLALFYPKLRGLTGSEAKTFLVSGMMKEVLERGGAGDRIAYEMSRIAEAIDKKVS